MLVFEPNINANKPLIKTQYNFEIEISITGSSPESNRLQLHSITVEMNGHQPMDNNSNKYEDILPYLYITKDTFQQSNMNYNRREATTNGNALSRGENITIPLRIMTYNVLNFNNYDTVYPWSQRKYLVAKVVCKRSTPIFSYFI